MRLSTKQYTQLARLIPLYCAIAAAEESSGLRDTICACMCTHTVCVFLSHYNEVIIEFGMVCCLQCTVE